MPLLSVYELSSLCVAALEESGFPRKLAEHLAFDLVRNEVTGHPSQGVLRLPEYAASVRNGLVDPMAEPEVVRKGKQGWIVDAHQGLGILAEEKIVDVLCSELIENSFVAVGLRNAGKLGRLSGIGRAVAKKGFIVIGFCNHRGASPRMAPFGAEKPLVSTNPILIACPRGDESEFVLDMSTSTVAVGSVRECFLNHKQTPEGWLFSSKDGTPTNDPSGLFTNPVQAVMTPLGGAGAGHKGFGLALTAEIMAGILTGGECMGGSSSGEGNGAVFFGIRPDVLGVPMKEFAKRVEALSVYCEEAKMMEGVSPLRIPGSRKVVQDGVKMEISMPVYNALTSLIKCHR